MSGASDEDLLAAHLEGDRTAFAELVTRHERRVYGLCLRVLGNREDAEDATQEAFIAALRRAETFRREAAFSTWLFRIAVNAATDQARRRGRARTVPLEAEEPGGSSAAGGDPSGAVTTALTVQAALRRVPEDFRVALILCDLYGFGHAQAAGVLEIPVPTARSSPRGRRAPRPTRSAPGPRRTWPAARTAPARWRRWSGGAPRSPASPRPRCRPACTSALPPRSSASSQRSPARRATRLAARTGSGWRRGRGPSASTDGSPAVVGHGPGTGGLLRSALPRP